MGSRAVTQDVYDNLVAAFREDPGNAAAAARKAGVMAKTARRAWHEGWPKRGMQSVDALFRAEQLEARAKLQRDAEAEAAKSRETARQAVAQASESRAQEAAVVKLARGAAQQALAEAAELAMSARALGARVASFLREQAKAQPSDEGAIGAQQALKLLSDVARLNQTIVNTAQTAMHMERLHLGEPTDILGHRSGAELPEKMSGEEALLRVRAAQQAAEAHVGRRLKLVGGTEASDVGAAKP